MFFSLNIHSLYCFFFNIKARTAFLLLKTHHLHRFQLNLSYKIQKVFIWIILLIKKITNLFLQTQQNSIKNRQHPQLLAVLEVVVMVQVVQTTSIIPIALKTNSLFTILKIGYAVRKKFLLDLRTNLAKKRLAIERPTDDDT